MINDLVSIITPSYNTADYIAETIQSVLNQTYLNWEMIIVDDCSTDNTEEEVAKFVDSRIRYIKSLTNGSAAASRNRALQEANGRWIAFLDSDDLWHPQKLEKQLKFMQENGYSFSYTNYGHIDEKSVKQNIIATGPKHITKWGMQNYGWPGCLTVMYDRKVVGDIQIPIIRKRNDYALWLKVIRKADCWLLDEELALYRKRSNSLSSTGWKGLVKYFYQLHRIVGEKKVPSAMILTIRNLFFGFWKKVAYVKKTCKHSSFSNLKD